MHGASKLDLALLGNARRAPAGPGEPFRDELLSVERLDERARSLAGRFTLDPRRRAARSALPRFEDNGHRLRDAYRDDESGAAWSPTPGPLPRDAASGRCVIRHGAG